MEAGQRSLRSVHALLSDVIEVIKLKQTLLLLASMYTAFIIGGGLAKPLPYHVEVLLIGFTSIASVTAINMYFDMDIDAMMERTRDRPLPRGSLNPRLTLLASLAALLISLYYGYILVNPYYALSILVGFIFDIFAYTLLLKRRTPLNIIAGAVAGGAPAMGGWAAARGIIDSNAILFSLIVIAWIPAHIWFLATFYRDDYRKANIPMLPAVTTDPHGVAAGIGLGALIIGYAVLGLYLNHTIGVASMLIGLLFSGYIFYEAMRYSSSGGDKLLARKMFIRVNMGLGAIFLAMILEKILSYV